MKNHHLKIHRLPSTPKQTQKKSKWKVLQAQVRNSASA